MVMQRLQDSTPDTFVVLDDRGGLLGWVPYTFLALDREPPSETVFLTRDEIRETRLEIRDSRFETREER